MWISFVLSPANIKALIQILTVFERINAIVSKLRGNSALDDPNCVTLVLSYPELLPDGYIDICYTGHFSGLRLCCQVPIREIFSEFGYRFDNYEYVSIDLPFSILAVLKTQIYSYCLMRVRTTNKFEMRFYTHQTIHDILKYVATTDSISQIEIEVNGITGALRSSQTAQANGIIKDFADMIRPKDMNEISFYGSSAVIARILHTSKKYADVVAVHELATQYVQMDFRRFKTETEMFSLPRNSGNTAGLEDEGSNIENLRVMYTEFQGTHTVIPLSTLTNVFILALSTFKVGNAAQTNDTAYLTEGKKKKKTAKITDLDEIESDEDSNKKKAQQKKRRRAKDGSSDDDTDDENNELTNIMTKTLNNAKKIDSTVGGPYGFQSLTALDENVSGGAVVGSKRSIIDGEKIVPGDILNASQEDYTDFIEMRCLTERSRYMDGGPTKDKVNFPNIIVTQPTSGSSFGISRYGSELSTPQTDTLLPPRPLMLQQQQNKIAATTGQIYPLPVRELLEESRCIITKYTLILKSYAGDVKFKFSPIALFEKMTEKDRVNIQQFEESKNRLNSIAMLPSGIRIKKKWTEKKSVKILANGKLALSLLENFFALGQKLRTDMSISLNESKLICQIKYSGSNTGQDVLFIGKMNSVANN